MRILNRSLPHARALAERTDADHGDLDALPTVLREADLVVSATGATGPVVFADVVRAARPASAAPLVLLDLAVPRDVEPEAGSLPGVTLIDVDALRDRGRRSRTTRSRRPARSCPRRSAGSSCVAAATNWLR